MESEKNYDLEQTANQQSEGKRYERVSRSTGNYNRENQENARPQRPRISRPRISSNDEGSFRTSGFGMSEQRQDTRQEGYRPRYNEGGYRPRQQSGYRPHYNQDGQEGGYQPRQQGSYRPRYNQDGQEGGYQPRQQGGYRPRYNQDGQEGGYQPRQQGDYRPRYNQDGQEGGYQPRQQSGYRPQGGGYRQGGGYQQRPQQGGYRPQQGGFRPNNFSGRPQQGGYKRQHNDDYDPHAKYSMKKRIEYREEHVDPNEPIRLNKFLANAGVCSRREADDFIQAGVVTVNGEVVTELGTKILRTDNVVFHEQPVSLEKKVYVLLNKPKDYVTTSDDPQQRKTVMDLVSGACPERIYPVGRLDRNTTGVLLLTNDGELASKLTHPKFLKKKVYHVFLDKNVTKHDLEQIAEGIQLEDGEIHADAVEYASPTDKSQVGIEIHSGKNRIVRRIFEALGYRVTKLDRVQFCGLTKKNVRRGDWRFLTEKEVEMLRMGAFE